MQDLITNSENALFMIVKIGLILFLVVYLVFSATIVKQIKIMSETLTTGFEFYLRVAGFLHFMFALIVLVLAVVIL